MGIKNVDIAAVEDVLHDIKYRHEDILKILEQPRY